jgi:predicted alpha/beta-hydrolase family hydrolase
VEEIQTALQLALRINEEGADVMHMKVSGSTKAAGLHALGLLKGRLDLDALVLGGHSYGGSTAASVF